MREQKLNAGKFDVDAPLVQRLVAAQFPQWADLPIRAVAQDGWDNWTFHLGDRMKVRLPSAEGYAEQAEKEARWLPKLAPHLPVPIPVPIGVGVPGEGYPWTWSVYEWLEGDIASRERIADLSGFAVQVAEFLAALQQIETTGGPSPGLHNFWRGGSLEIYEADARRSIAALDGMIDTAGANAVMDTALAAKWAGPPFWVHGDIAVGNLLVRDGRLSAVIDFGSSAVGDPACDLVIAFVFFDRESRSAFGDAVPADPGMWDRARGWALWKAALVAAANGAINPAEAPPLKVIEDVVADWRGRA